MKIVQLLPNIRTGDAVSNDALLLHELLLSYDRETAIYARVIGPNLPSAVVRPSTKLPRLSENDMVIYHLSVGDMVSRQLEQLPCKKVMVFHNITPPSYFEPYSREYTVACAQGYEELKRLREQFDFAICDSDFNRQVLLELGYDCPMAVCPVFIPMEDYSIAPDAYTMEKYGDGRTNILFVGRLAPNKRQEDVIAAFAAYREKYDPTARLILAGNETCPSYVQRLRDYVRSLGVPSVKITGHVSFPALLALYRQSSALLCMSEHEGFCVPLVEAMVFDLPIVARDSSAVGETLGGSGVLLPDNNPDSAAAALHHLLTDAAYREKILASQRKRLPELTGAAVREKKSKLIEQAIALPPGKRKPRFIQALPRLSRGDAIGDEVLTLRELSLSHKEYSSTIWTGSCEDVVLQGAVYVGEEAPKAESEDICLYHFASGDKMAEQFLRMKCRKVLRYHGMTPAHFFSEYSQGYVGAAQRGEKELKKLIDATEEQWANSEYDRAQLLALGAKNTKVLPLLLDRENFVLHGINDSVFDDGNTNILFVGRLAPNKKVDNLIAAFACYQERYDKQARLLLCGDMWALENYTRKLQAYVGALQVKNVYFLGKVSQAELGELYHCASALVTLSEHEGFCVPLVEAMLTQTPVLALDAAAIGDTLGRNTPGLLPDSGAETVAEALHKLMSDDNYRRELLKKQGERARELAPEKVGILAETLIQGLWEKKQ